jgi:oligo-1,6-glucosidase
LTICPSSLENHDQARSIPRFASKDPQYRTIAGKLLAAMHTTLSGTVFIYQGEELGMVNVPQSFQLEDFKGKIKPISLLK